MCGRWQWRFGGWIRYIDGTQGDGHRCHGDERHVKKVSGGTIFVDHASGFIHVANQVTLRASDTIIWKRRFEQMASRGGVKIAQYRADNGIFSSREFEDEIERTNQAIFVVEWEPSTKMVLLGDELERWWNKRV